MFISDNFQFNAVLFTLECMTVVEENKILRLQTTTDMAKRNYSIVQLLQPQASIYFCDEMFFTLHTFVPLCSNHNAHNANTPNSCRTCKVA